MVLGTGVEGDLNGRGIGRGKQGWREGGDIARGFADLKQREEGEVEQEHCVNSSGTGIQLK